MSFNNSSLKTGHYITDDGTTRSCQLIGMAHVLESKQAFADRISVDLLGHEDTVVVARIAALAHERSGWQILSPTKADRVLLFNDLDTGALFGALPRDFIGVTPSGQPRFQLA